MADDHATTTVAGPTQPPQGSVRDLIRRFQAMQPPRALPTLFNTLLPPSARRPLQHELPMTQEPSQPGDKFYQLGARWVPRQADGTWSAEVLEDMRQKSVRANACVVCNDQLGQLVCVQGVEVESWNKRHACTHRVCLTCARAWIDAQLSDQISCIRCPALNCKYVLYDEDVRTLVGSVEGMYARYSELRARTFRGRLENEEDAGFKQWVAENARLCRNCHVVLWRHAGCNKVVCTCGYQLCYACGGRYGDCDCMRLAEEAERQRRHQAAEEERQRWLREEEERMIQLEQLLLQQPPERQMLLQSIRDHSAVQAEQLPQEEVVEEEEQLPEEHEWQLLELQEQQLQQAVQLTVQAEQLPVPAEQQPTQPAERQPERQQGLQRDESVEEVRWIM